MNASTFQRMSDDELVKRFVEIGLAQDDALLGNEIARFNELYAEMRAIRDELKSRPADPRQALLRLYDHPNAQVRLNAAKSTLAIAPEAARQLLQSIEDSKKHPQAGDAGMSLLLLDKGIFKPT
jgi:hypothetical protein